MNTGDIKYFYFPLNMPSSSDCKEDVKKKARKLEEKISMAVQNFHHLQAAIPEVLASQALTKDFEHLQKDLKEASIQHLKDQDSLHANLTRLQFLRSKQPEMHKMVSALAEALQSWQTHLSSRMQLNVEGESEDSVKYGNKHARLVEQAQIFKSIPLPGVVVLDPHGISTDVPRVLFNSLDPQIKALWSNLSAMYANAASGNPSLDFLQKKEVLQELEKIRALITEAFVKVVEDPHLFAKMGLDDALIAWLQELKENDRYLMVRSSGAEDSRKTANAGGNESVAYVAPDFKAFSLAIGKVISSYYTEGSLQIRLNSGENPFAGEMRTSLTNQELIGEKIGGESDLKHIPVSLVLFSNEPTYVGNEPFRVMRISATYGHGEGVVEAKGVQSDTFMILRSVKHPERLYFVKDIHAKPVRLAPIKNPDTGDVTLELIKNPSELTESPALDDEMLTRLFYVGLAVEKVYGNHPMDMEMVVKDGKIYPVQARPVNRPPQNPTYLDLKKLSREAKASQKIQIEPFLPGLAQAQIIKSQDQILVVDNLEKAQKLFKKGQHLLVIIREEEAANSHPVVNFSGLGLPVMVSENTDAIKAILKQIDAKRALIACVQSGQLLLCGENEKPENLISTGYVVHPANMAISVHNKVLPPAVQKGEEALPQDLKELFTTLRAYESQEIALKTLKEIRKHPCLQQIAEARSRLSERLKSHPGFPKRGSDLVKGLEKLDKKIQSAASELKATIKSGQQERLHFLFHAKAVETLVSQTSTSRALGRLSALNVRSQIAAVEKMLDYQEKFNFTPQFTANILDTAALFSQEQEEKWQNFITHLDLACHAGEMSEQEVQDFQDLLNTLRENNSLPLWMARFFLPQIAQQNLLTSKDAVILARGLLAGFTTEAQAFLKELGKLREEIAALEDHLDKFAEPLLFDQVWQQLFSIFEKFACNSDKWSQNYVSFFMWEDSDFVKKVFPILSEINEKLVNSSNKWEDKINAAKSLERINAYQVMKEFVNLFDLAIKKMKGSPHLDVDKRHELLYGMLIVYQDLMQGWYEKMPLQAILSEKSIAFSPNTLYEILTEYYLPNFVDKHKLWKLTWYEEEDKEKNLLPSEKFNVSAAVFGKINYDRSHPKTLEDFFTLIHRNLLNCLQLLMTQEIKGNVVLPLDMETWQTMVSQICPEAKMGGYSFSMDTLTLHYDYPLRNHGAEIAIIFDKNKESYALKVSFLGQARQRWARIASILNFFDRAELIDMEQTPKMIASGLECQLHLSQTGQNRFVFELLKRCANCTMSDSNTVISSFPDLFAIVEEKKGPRQGGSLSQTLCGRRNRLPSPKISSCKIRSLKYKLAVLNTRGAKRQSCHLS